MLETQTRFAFCTLIPIFFSADYFFIINNTRNVRADSVIKQPLAGKVFFYFIVRVPKSLLRDASEIGKSESMVRAEKVLTCELMFPAFRVNASLLVWISIQAARPRGHLRNATAFSQRTGSVAKWIKNRSRSTSTLQQVAVLHTPTALPGRAELLPPKRTAEPFFIPRPADAGDEPPRDTVPRPKTGRKYRKKYTKSRKRFVRLVSA